MHCMHHAVHLLHAVDNECDTAQIRTHYSSDLYRKLVDILSKLDHYENNIHFYPLPEIKYKT